MHSPSIITLITHPPLRSFGVCAGVPSKCHNYGDRAVTANFSIQNYRLKSTTKYPIRRIRHLVAVLPACLSLPPKGRFSGTGKTTIFRPPRGEGGFGKKPYLYPIYTPPGGVFW